ncbi:mitotic checkpoint regulator, MAD2B-interacting-domain-containing protein [Apodospora peruviana]|uniref:Mitotic checkpoint regulator, MAD2B-interacting-domain-containing protein n=1 Tax=Apodospora peruviana TaxID=516989 RepID=A0AAE0HVW7_9PEZI|nr:mitotic checkpoint regulator, MAD2B-interacting-domain-containing protein [Apodospora peruviana]
MGLVDYSDSESDSASEVVQKPAPAATPATTATAKKPFQKLVDRAGSGKIVVNLPSAADTRADPSTGDEPPAKRARTVGTSSSRFSNFGSFLPPPKKPAAAIGRSAPESSSASVQMNNKAPALGIHLKTGAEPAFIRGGPDSDHAAGDEGTNGSGPFQSGLKLPPPKMGPTIPAGNKTEEEVKLVGKPLMFRPLSVSRKPGQKKKKEGVKAAAASSATPSPQISTQQEVAPPPKKKVSLFSMGAEDGTETTITTTATADGAYKPLFAGAAETEDVISDDAAPEYDDYHQTTTSAQYQKNQQQQPQTQQSLSSIADDLSLSKAARRELFGRNGPDSSSVPGGAIPANSRIINFNMEQEYAHNEALRTSGAADQVVYNPVRSIAPGKHSLRQIVNMAQNNQAALEDSFAAGKNNRKDAAGKYGWK